MGTEQVTGRDVAKRANVSISTVSRVLPGNAPVSLELRQRVIEAIEELGYRPNALARGLRMRRTAVIALLIPDISNPFFGQLASVVEEEARSRGFATLLCNSQNNRERELQYLDLLYSQQVDGLLIVTSENIARELDELARATGAVVCALDRRIPEFDGPWIGTDPYPGAYEAVTHLVELGHENIGILRGIRGKTSSDERYYAIVRALDEHGLPPPRWTWTGENTLQTGIEAGANLAQMPEQERPTAVITTSEFSAYGLIEGVSRHGLSVPEELSVIGFDNTAIAEVFRPPLTVIAQPIERMGAIAVAEIVNLLMARKDPKTSPVAPVAGTLRPPEQDEQRTKNIVLPSFLVKRESTIKVR